MKHNKKFKIIFFSILILILFSQGVYGGEVTGDIESWSGHTSYTIEGSDWKSLLEFPLNIQMASLNFSKEIDNSNEIPSRFSVELKKNITKDAGTFKDTDWVDGKDEKDIYGETETTGQSFIIDGNIGFMHKKINEDLILKSKVGYEYQNFNFVAHDGEQIDYRTDSRVEIPGDAIEYNVKYRIPYISLGGNFENENFVIENHIELSPYVTSSDEDYHILRDKWAYIKSKGYSFNTNGVVLFKALDNLDIGAEASYQKINTQGEQRQEFSDGSVIEGINAKINSDQTYFGFKGRFKF